MKVPVYSYRDRHVGFMTPMTDVNRNSAVRNFKFAINNVQNGVMHYAPEDYDLYCIGMFDSDTGVFEGQIPELIVTGISVYDGEKKDG